MRFRTLFPTSLGPLSDERKTYFRMAPAAEGHRKLGVTVPSGRGSVATVKPNPCIRIRAWALSAACSIKRELVFLREEEALALKAVIPDDDEFAGLD